MQAPLVGREAELDLLARPSGSAWSPSSRPHLVTDLRGPGHREEPARARAPPAAQRRAGCAADPHRTVPLVRRGRHVLAAGRDPEPPRPTRRRRPRRDRCRAHRGARGGASPRHCPRPRHGARSLSPSASTPAIRSSQRLQPSALRVELHRTWRTLFSVLAEREPLVARGRRHPLGRPRRSCPSRGGCRPRRGPLLLVCPARPELTGPAPDLGRRQPQLLHRLLARSARTPRPSSSRTCSTSTASVTPTRGADPRPRRGQPVLPRGDPPPTDRRRAASCTSDGRWKATDSLPTIELPDTVQGVLAARIDLLQPREKRHAATGIRGRPHLLAGAVAALIEDDETLDPDLRQLEERELVARAVSLDDGRGGGARLQPHPHARRRLRKPPAPRAPPRTRPVARWIEEITGDRQREYGALLAHHYVEAYRGARVTATPATSSRSYGSARSSCCSSRRRARLRGAAYGAAARSPRPRSSSHRPPRTARPPTRRSATPHATPRSATTPGRHTRPPSTRSATRAHPTTTGSAASPALLSRPSSRWSGTMKDLPPRKRSPRPTSTNALEHVAARRQRVRVRLVTALAFWSHGFPTTTHLRPTSDARRAGGRGPR